MFYYTGMKRFISCDFDDVFMCGYTHPMISSQLKWFQTKYGSEIISELSSDDSGSSIGK
jgi:hypothetical protein